MTHSFARRFVLTAAFAVAAGWGAMPAHAENITLNVWSHEADEDAKVALREQAARDLEKAHPGLTVKITWYEKNPLLAALKTALPAGQGPDVFYVEPDWTEYVTAGYLTPLDDLVNWKTIQPWARQVWVHDGKTYGLPQEAYTNEIYYNKDLLKKLGVDLPANAQFTQSQFLDLVKKAKAAGMTPIAQGVGDRPFPGAYIVGEALLRKLGKEDYRKLFTGKLSFTDPRVVEVFKWTKELVDAGAYPKNFMTLKLGESHYYFYSKPGALMLPMGSWYTGRAFVPEEKGGQPKDFPLGVMQFPAMELRDQRGEQAEGARGRVPERDVDARHGQALDRDGVSTIRGRRRREELQRALRRLFHGADGAAEGHRLFHRRSPRHGAGHLQGRVRPGDERGLPGWSALGRRHAEADECRLLQGQLKPIGPPHPEYAPLGPRRRTHSAHAT